MSPSLFYDPVAAELVEAFSALDAYASPRVQGPPQVAAEALVRALEQRLALPAAFALDVLKQAGRLATLTSRRRVALQLVQCLPDAALPYLPGVEVPHIDWDRGNITARGVRLIRVYSGAGTCWLPRERDPEALRRLRREPEATVAQVHAALTQADGFEQVPPDTVFVYPGGLHEGVVHHAPRCDTRRLLLVATV